MINPSDISNPSFAARIARVKQRRQLDHERNIQQLAQQKKNLDTIVTNLIDSAQKQSLQQSSRFEAATRSMFGGASLRAIERMIQAEVKRREMLAEWVLKEWYRRPSDDPFVLHVAISIHW